MIFLDSANPGISPPDARAVQCIAKRLADPSLAVHDRQKEVAKKNGSRVFANSAPKACRVGPLGGEAQAAYLAGSAGGAELSAAGGVAGAVASVWAASSACVSAGVVAGAGVVFEGVGAAGSQPTAAKLKTATRPKYFFIGILQWIQSSSQPCGAPARTFSIIRPPRIRPCLHLIRVRNEPLYSGRSKKFRTQRKNVRLGCGNAPAGTAQRQNRFSKVAKADRICSTAARGRALRINARLPLLLLVPANWPLWI